VGVKNDEKRHFFSIREILNSRKPIGREIKTKRFVSFFLIETVHTSKVKQIAES